MMEERVLLEIRDLRVDLTVNRETLHALRGVDLTVQQGDMLALVGESGSGKSMTGLSIMRLLPATARVISGTLRFADTDLLALSETEMRARRGKQLAMIFQNAGAALNPLVRVGDQIAAIYQHRHGLTKRDAWTKAVDTLRQTGIPDPASRARSYPHEFSGGMAQRVLIALALASQPALLIADEPTSGLDVTIQVQVVELIKDVVRRLNTTLIMISHDIGLVATICNRIAVMYAGMVMESGSADQIMRRSANPYTTALIACAMTQGEASRMPFIPGRAIDLRLDWQGCPFARRCAFVQSVCHTHAPPIVEIGPGHVSRCHFARDVQAQREGTPA